MIRLLLTLCVAVFLLFAAVPHGNAADSNPPSAQLIKPHSKSTRTVAAVHPPAGPVDERCKPLKQELESTLKQHGRSRKGFQAQLAHNAGTRLCRVGQAEKGMAEFRKGLSYFD